MEISACKEFSANSVCFLHALAFAKSHLLFKIRLYNGVDYHKLVRTGMVSHLLWSNVAEVVILLICIQKMCFI